MNNNYLEHHGVKGMKWGVRRRREALNAYSGARRSSTAKTGIGKRVDANKAYRQSMKDSSNANKNVIKEKYNGLSDKQKTALTIGATAAATALASYGTYKVNKFIRDKGYEKNYNSGKKAVARWMEDQKYENMINDYFSYTKEDHYRTATQTIKQLISNNEVNGKVDWKNVLKTFK